MKNLCCTDPKNLVEADTFSRCVVCGCRHFRVRANFGGIISTFTPGKAKEQKNG